MRTRSNQTPSNRRGRIPLPFAASYLYHFLALFVGIASVGFGGWVVFRIYVLKQPFSFGETPEVPPEEKNRSHLNTPEFIIVHHTSGDGKPENITFEAVDKYHRQQGWDMIGYHYFIAWDGTLYKGRQDRQEGAHTKENGLNYMSISVCLAGNFDRYMPTDAQVRTLRHLLKQKMREYDIKPQFIFPHRMFTNVKSCYGGKLRDNWAKIIATTNDLPPSNMPIAPQEIARKNHRANNSRQDAS